MARHELVAVGGEVELGEAAQGPAAPLGMRGEIPDFDDMILAGSGEPFAVRADDTKRDRAIVGLEGAGLACRAPYRCGWPPCCWHK